MKKDSKLSKSLWYAITGIGWAVARERNMRIHLCFMVAVVSLSLALGVTLVEVALLSMAIFLVLALELVNTGIEQVVDLAVHGKIHPGAKVAKDVAAGAVLVAAINAIIIGLTIFMPKILALGK